MSGQLTADGTLIIMVCRGRHLPNRRKLDKQSPYVLLRIGTEAKKTSACFRAGQTPEWTQEIRFQLIRERRPILKLDVLDETKNDPTPVGNIEIDCSMVFLDPANFRDGKYILDDWYELSCNGRRAGKIYLEMTFYPSAPLLPPKVSRQASVSSMPDIYDKPLVPIDDEDFLRTDPVQNRTVDEIFGQKAHEFRSSDPGASTAPTRSPGQQDEASNADDIFVSASQEKKKHGRFLKLKAKFQAKEPLSNFFHLDTRGAASHLMMDDDLPPSPLDDIGHLLDELDVPYHTSNRRTSFQLPLPPPPPPPHSSKPSSPSPRAHSRASSAAPTPQPKSPRRVGRKPPPPDLGLATSRMHELDISSTLAPFSADTIGVDEDELPTRVFKMGEAVKSLTHKASHEETEHTLNPHEIDPKYYAPTPSEHLAKTFRIQSGKVTHDDLKVDLNTQRSGYLGNGKFSTDKRFSPSVFQRVNDENAGEENKPAVPPKIPKGLTEMEYFVLERDKYLRDVNGRRS